VRVSLVCNTLADWSTGSVSTGFFLEEFGIYLNYVRKLGFEETPDYDFLRELFAKVMKNNGDVDDGVFDWNLLNDGRGWEASPGQQGQNTVLNQIQAGADRKRDTREDRRRSQAGPVVPPSPALVRHGSKSRKIPPALVPGAGQQAASSGAAQVNVPASQPRGTHPYANAANGVYEDYDVGNASHNAQQYPRASPMSPSVGAVPPAVSQVRAQAGQTGVSHGGDYHGQDMDEPPRKNTLFRILTCRC